MRTLARLACGHGHRASLEFRPWDSRWRSRQGAVLAPSRSTRSWVLWSPSASTTCSVRPDATAGHVSRWWSTSSPGGKRCSAAWCPVWNQAHRGRSVVLAGFRRGLRQRGPGAHSYVTKAPSRSLRTPRLGGGTAAGRGAITSFSGSAAATRGTSAGTVTSSAPATSSRSGPSRKRRAPARPVRRRAGTRVRAADPANDRVAGRSGATSELVGRGCDAHRHWQGTGAARLWCGRAQVSGPGLTWRPRS